jgi:hypothetical protein
MKSFSVILRPQPWITLGNAILSVLTFQSMTLAQPLIAPNPVYYQLVVNSNRDGAIAADEVLTLREAIALANGSLKVDQLTALEQAQVTVVKDDRSHIEFDLPSDQATISLVTELPPLAQAGLILDGTTQPGYGNDPPHPDPETSLQEDHPAQSRLNSQSPEPWVTLTPATPLTIPRGLTIIADNITVQGLQLYGFNNQQSQQPLALTGNIVVTAGRALFDLGLFPEMAQLTPPRQVHLERNWFGSSETPTAATASAFGVVLFDSVDTTIASNRFWHHLGSAVLTGIEAPGLTLENNWFWGNGGAGMPDAIRLEGSIEGSQITHNTICHSAGSAIFLFKPQGSVTIAENQIADNGTRFDRSAIHLMGNNHQVLDNQIIGQPGAGVVVAAYPKSFGNRIQGNVFGRLRGLSIDLVTRNHREVSDYNLGDGVNPWRDSDNRRRDTANGAINTPQFVGSEFFPFDGQVTIAGKADPGSTIDLYQVLEPHSDHGPLSQLLIAGIPVDETGTFKQVFTTLKLGDRITAIATDPRYGTSEPARNAVIRTPAEANLPLPEENATLPETLSPCQEEFTP